MKLRWKRSLVIVSGSFVVLWAIASYVVANRLTQRDRPPFAEPVPPVEWGKLEAHRLATADGEELGAWFVPGEKPLSVLLLHGNGGTRRSSLSRSQLFAEMGNSVLAITLRAHGDSTGNRSDIGYSSHHDVIAAVEFLERRNPDSSIVVAGFSLGAAAAIFAAAQLEMRVNGYLLEAPYRDLRRAVRHRTELYLPPILDRFAYIGLMAVSPLVIPDIDLISPLDRMSDIPESVPVLLLAGTEDRRARPEEMWEFYQRVDRHGRLIFFEGVGHESLLDRKPKFYRQVVLEWLETVNSTNSEWEIE